MSRAHLITVLALALLASGCSSDCPEGQVPAAQDRQGTRNVCVPAEATNGDTTTGTTTADTSTGDSDTSSTTTADTTSTGPAPCDDDPACGPGEDLDTCPEQCSVCGDGVRSGPEACDNGPDNRTYWPSTPPDGACSDDCTLDLQWCGDATQNADESCDNGPNTDAPYHPGGAPPPGACAPGCLPVAYCGDNLQNGPDELCDTAGNTRACDDDCTTPACGDGTLNPAAAEVCDDSNSNDADNCSADCLFHQRRVFVSSTDFQGDMNFALDNPAMLSGIPLADARCQQLATVAGLSGNYKAWLSDDTTSPAQRFDTTFEGRYRLLSPINNLVAAGWADLIDGTLTNPIAADEHGTPPKTPNVWTNTLPDGTPVSAMDHCSNWTKTMGTTSVGQSSAIDATWTNLAANQLCSNALRIYCFEDP